MSGVGEDDDEGWGREGERECVCERVSVWEWRWEMENVIFLFVLWKDDVAPLHTQHCSKRENGRGRKGRRGGGGVVCGGVGEWVGVMGGGVGGWEKG